MVTLTTLIPGPSGNASYGYRLYLDGLLAGELATPEAPGGKVPGGGPITLSQAIFLCSSVEGMQSQVFNGYMAHLMLFKDVRLPELSVRAALGGGGAYCSSSQLAGLAALAAHVNVC